MRLRKHRQDSTYNTLRYSQFLSTLKSAWRQVDSIPLSRPKRNIAAATLLTEVRLTAPPAPARVSLMRADVARLSAVLVAEIVHHYFPKLVELHNYRHVSG